MGIVAKNVGKLIGNPATRVLTDISLEINDGDFVALTGRSGSGKSTLLYLLSSLDTVSEGAIEFSGKNIAHMKSDELNRFRNHYMGFVFQFHYLIAELSALENVLLPSKKADKEAENLNYAKDLLGQFGLGKKMDRLPRQLSGGEQQRVAIARALSTKPKYLFADEPTGALDSVNGELVMKMIMESNQAHKTTIILVTHDPDFAQMAHKQVFLADGKIVSKA